MSNSYNKSHHQNQDSEKNLHRGQAKNNNNNDGSFVSITYARTDEPIGDVDPLTGAATTMGSDSKINIHNNTSMDLALASPMSTASMKDLKRSYHQKKKYFTKNIQSAIDSTQEVHSGWLKARTTFKRWTKMWCQVKPGYLILYTSQEAQKKHRLGVVLLSVCQLIKRPTKKDGFCFKLINPFGCSVWAKSSTKAIVFAQASLTLRVSDDTIGRLWLDALQRCHLSSNLEGYQPIIDDDSFTRGSGANSRLGDTGESSDGDGDQSTKGIEYILTNCNNTSDNNSLSSLPQRSKNKNLIKQNDERSTNYGSTPLNHEKFINNSRPAGSFEPGDTSSQKQINDNLPTFVRSENVIKHESNRASQSPRQQNTMPLSQNDLNNSTETCINSVFDMTKKNGTGVALNMNCQKMVAKFTKYSWRELQLENVSYLEDGAEELGTAGVQSEEVHDSNKNFLWHIIKQLRPGMDLSKVTLPTFILEPRSFLEKLADYYYHSDILSEAVLVDDPVLRLINIVKWYLSGFYKKPKGPKKPYNPILGERFRCFWEHPKTKSRTFFVAEQISHHPPISAFHVSNRKDGYTITCALLSRSKYGGNSVSAILDGKAKLYLTKRRETYTITMPYANCRGILLGSLCMELGGKVEIECLETNCKCELEFKLASMWANQSSYNTLTGKILKDNKVTHTLDGHWDKKINISDKCVDRRSTLWKVTDDIRNSRLKRFTVSLKDQDERESVKLWSKVTEALIAGNQVVATAEKTRLEDMQRKEARERQGPFVPRHFQQSPQGAGEWFYKWQDDRIWDDRRDISQFEDNFKIRTLMFCPSDVGNGNGGSNSELNSDETIDLPLTRLSRFASQIRGFDDWAQSIVQMGSKKAAANRKTFPTDEAEQAFRSMESRIAAVNSLVEDALKLVKERNKKLEEDIALLKRARGKRTLALFMTAFVIALISAFYKFLS